MPGFFLRNVVQVTIIRKAYDFPYVPIVATKSSITRARLQAHMGAGGQWNEYLRPQSSFAHRTGALGFRGWWAEGLSLGFRVQGLGFTVLVGFTLENQNARPESLEIFRPRTWTVPQSPPQRCEPSSKSSASLASWRSGGR